jgi:hypothetical protein
MGGQARKLLLEIKMCFLEEKALKKADKIKIF